MFAGDEDDQNVAVAAWGRTILKSQEPPEPVESRRLETNVARAEDCRSRSAGNQSADAQLRLHSLEPMQCSGMQHDIYSTIFLRCPLLTAASYRLHLPQNAVPCVARTAEGEVLVQLNHDDESPHHCINCCRWVMRYTPDSGYLGYQ